MADESEKYNGWSNRETWAIKLHWDNNEGDYTFFTVEAKLFKRKDDLMGFADFLQEKAEDIYYSVINTNDASEEAKRFVEDVGSLWRVNWREIAESYFED